MIPLARPHIGLKELLEVQKVFSSRYLVQGPKVAEFEKLIADYVGARHAVAVTSCTAALHLSLVALGIGPGSDIVQTVVLQSVTFGDALPDFLLVGHHVGQPHRPHHSAGNVEGFRQFRP